MNLTARELENIFGPDSNGATVEQRAATSKRLFVRSQVQLAIASDSATGHRLTAKEALRDYGLDLLRKVGSEGSAPLVVHPTEPAETLRKRRDELKLSEAQVGKRAGLDEARVVKAETPGSISPIRDLEKLAAALALDERQLGIVRGANGDRKLGVRLREIHVDAGDAVRFSSGDVLALAESAWVIARQDCLEVAEGSRSLFKPNANYSYPAYTRGYELAEQTRSLLGMSAEEPVASLRTLIEERLVVPVIQQKLDEKFAGATIANGKSRGIVVNESGRNKNVGMRRMTMAHELGHLLWDPDSNLNRLTVDRYDDFDVHHDKKSRKDPVEIRANAFAVAFLAPPDGVRRIAHGSSNPADALREVMATYGISQSAARHHLRNVTDDVNFLEARISGGEELTDEWLGQENQAIDIFPMETTPISRRGRFAWLVARRFREGDLSSDSAGILLNCARDLFEKKADFLLNVAATSDQSAYQPPQRKVALDVRFEVFLGLLDELRAALSPLYGEDPATYAPVGASGGGDYVNVLVELTQRTSTALAPIIAEWSSRARNTVTIYVEGQKIRGDLQRVQEILAKKIAEHVKSDS